MTNSIGRIDTGTVVQRFAQRRVQHVLSVSTASPHRLAPILPPPLDDPEEAPDTLRNVFERGFAVTL